MCLYKYITRLSLIFSLAFSFGGNMSKAQDFSIEAALITPINGSQPVGTILQYAVTVSLNYGSNPSQFSSTISNTVRLGYLGIYPAYQEERLQIQPIT